MADIMVNFSNTLERSSNVSCTDSNDSDGFTTNGSDCHQSSVVELAQQYPIYWVGVGINNYYVPFLVPIGLVGNTLSFLVSMNFI